MTDSDPWTSPADDRVLHAVDRISRGATREQDEYDAWLTAVLADDPAAGASPNGARAAASEVEQRRAQFAAAMLNDAALAKLPQPEPIVDGWFYRDTMAWLHGKPGSYKSFVALDLAACVANGRDWHSHACTTGPVVYIVAEGTAGTSRRVEAWKSAHGEPDSRIQFLAAAPQVMDPTDRAALIALLHEHKPVLVVVDTQSRVSVGTEENSAKDASALVAAIDEIRAATRACVLLVHHEPRAGEHLRGSTAFEGAAGTIVRIERDGRQLTLRNTKQKDAAEAGEMVLSFAPVGDSGTVFHGLSVPTSSEIAVLDALRNQFGTSGAAWGRLGDVTGLPKSTLSRALKSLRDRGLVVIRESGGHTYYVATADETQLTVPTVPPSST